MRFLLHAIREQCTFFLGLYIFSRNLVAHKNFLNDHNMQVDISYLNISFGILNRNSMKNEMINFIILLAKYYIYASKYKQQKPNFEGFKNILKQRKEIEDYNALSKDKLDYHNQKWGFLCTVL